MGQALFGVLRCRLMPRPTSLSPWQGRLAGCPTCGALAPYPCVVTTASKLAKLERSRQWKPGDPLPECQAIHPARTLRAADHLTRHPFAA
jgi:hypothetical protein